MAPIISGRDQVIFMSGKTCPALRVPVYKFKMFFFLLLTAKNEPTFTTSNFLKVLLRTYSIGFFVPSYYEDLFVRRSCEIEILLKTLFFSAPESERKPLSTLISQVFVYRFERGSFLPYLQAWCDNSHYTSSAGVN